MIATRGPTTRRELTPHDTTRLGWTEEVLHESLSNLWRDLT